MRKTLFILGMAALGTAGVAQADIRIDARQVNQQRQIDAVKRSGKLSLGERRILTNEQRAIKREEARFKRSYGRFTQREKAVIDGRLNRAQAHINRLKNNRRRGPDDVPF